MTDGMRDATGRTGKAGVQGTTDKVAAAPSPDASLGHGRLVKSEGSFYTPAPIAESIVRLAGLGAADPSTHVMDPAAGDGALLVPAVAAMCSSLGSRHGMSAAEAASAVTSLVHAVELDAGEAAACRRNLSAAVGQATGESVEPAEWDVVVGDACSEWVRFEGSMSAVVMNPPYVRIHNLAQRPDSPYAIGMCDLYYAFFDYAQRMLADAGRLVAIAPSSWMTSRAGRAMREDVMRRDALRVVCDYGHYQVFAPYALTYTAIVGIGEALAADGPAGGAGGCWTGAGRVALLGHDGEGRILWDGAEEVEAASCWHGGLLMPGAPEAMDEVLATPARAGGVRVSTGYQTSLDRLFMSGERRFSAYEIPVVKASTGQRGWAAYPYDGDGRLATLDEIGAADASLAELLAGSEGALRARNHVVPDAWWAYGRTQGIADTFRDKVATQLLFLPPTPPRTTDAPAGTGVVGGAYVVGMGKEEVDRAFASRDFMAYATALRKYKSDGYYAVSGRDLERFLGWWRTRREP